MQGEFDVFEPWNEGVPADNRRLYAEAASLHGDDPERARQIFAALALKLPDDQVIGMWLERLSV